MNKRVNWIDIAKGILIILVILGHSKVNNTTAYLINSFHMAAFFTLSGYTYNLSSPISTFTIRKIKTILIPYICFSIIYLSYQYAKSIVFTGNNFNFFEGLISIILPVIGRNGTSVYGLWFLPCLFITEITLKFLITLFKRNRIISILSSLMIACFSFVCVYCFKIVSVLSILPIAAVFILIGILIRHNISTIYKYRITVLSISFVLFLASAFANRYLSNVLVDLSSLNLGNILLYFASCIFGTFVTISISMIINNQKFLQWIGKNSLYFYGLHYIFLAIAEKLIPFSGILQTTITLVALIPVIFIYNKLKLEVCKKNDKHNSSGV